MYKYSPDATRLANVTQDGRLIIWNKNSEIHQTYSPSSHLSAQITCLAWAPAKTKKKGKEVDEGGSSDLIALGTSAGSVLLYSVKQGDIVTTFDVSNHKVLCLAWSNSGKSVTCGSEQGEITICCILTLEVLSRFKANKTAVHALAITADDKKIITASQKLKVFEVQTQKLLQTFVGHSNPVVSLNCIEVQNDNFVMSVAAEDRNVSIWKIGEEVEAPKKAEPVYITLSVNDAVRDLACLNVKESEVTSSATSESGKVSIFRFSLEKAKKKPMKAYSCVHIMNEGQDKINVIPVFSTYIIERDVLYLNLTYGSDTKVKLEEIKVSDLRDNHILAREMPMIKVTGKIKEDYSKVVPMENAPGAKFLMALSGTSLPRQESIRGEKRPLQSKHLEQTLEERLDLLKTTPGKKSDSMSRLLIQGLQSNNTDILRSVLDNDNPQTIEATVKTLPLDFVVPLLRNLHQRIQFGSGNQVSIKWAEAVIRYHVGFLVSSPQVHSEILLPLNDLISAKLANFLPVMKLKGKIEIICEQLEQNRSQDTDNTDQPPLITYQDESDDDDFETLDTLLPPRLDYESDFLDEYLSEGGADGKSSADDDESESSDSNDDVMETDAALTNGHGSKNGGGEDDMIED